MGVTNVKGELHYPKLRRKEPVEPTPEAEAKLERVKAGLKKRINEEKDSIYVYKVRDAKWIDKEVLGEERNLTETII